MGHEEGVEVTVQKKLDVYHFAIGVDLNAYPLPNLIGANRSGRIVIGISAVAADGTYGGRTVILADTYNIAILLAGEFGGAIRDDLIEMAVALRKKRFIRQINMLGIGQMNFECESAVDAIYAITGGL